MKVLVIPDIHLKPYIFESARGIMNRGEAEVAVCLMDIPDDWGKEYALEEYANTYDADEVFALINLIEQWAAEEPTYHRFGGAIGRTKGLDGAYADYYAGMLARLYQIAPSEFAWACLGNASDENEKHTLALLSYHWNMPVEDVRAKLAADIGQN